MRNYLNNLIENKKAVIDNNEKNINFLREAYLFAEKNSTDVATWTGAVIVREEKIISYGANRFAPGVEHKKERMERPKKYYCQDHAERNAIFLAAKEGISTNGTKMFMPWVHCAACANAIITCGINELVVHYDKCIKTPSDWLEEIKEAISMLDEAGVRLTIVNEKIGDCKSKFRGDIWSP